MRKSYLLAVMAAIVLSICLIGAYGIAQQPPARPAAYAPAAGAMPNIAILDVSYIFKKHARFKAMMDEMKADVDRAEGVLKQEREAMQKLAERLANFNKGTPDYKALAEEITKREADLAVKVRLQKEEFFQREAKIYHNVYQEILQEVDYYAAASGINLVLRFNGDPADLNQPETVIRDINKQVVWYAKDRDITPVILDRLNQRAYRNPGAAAPGAPAAPAGPVGVRPNTTPAVPFQR